MFKTIKTLIAVAALSGTVGANVQAQEVTVQKGDTLWELSQVHNASVENIKKWNHLGTDLIHPEDILQIATKKHYMVNQGDTLFNIANENHVSVQNLIDWNDLYTNLIHQGLDLVIYDDSVTPTKMAPVKQVEVAPEPNSTQASQTPEGSQTTEKTSASAPMNSVLQQVDEPKPLFSKPEASVPTTAPAPASVQAPAPAPVSVQAPTPAPAVEQSDSAKEITVKATAYTASCEGCTGITKTGVNLKENPDEKVIAVDPSVIPLGSKVLVEGYGEATAADTGGAIKGNRIDVYMQNQSDALQFGAKELTIKIVN